MEKRVGTWGQGSESGLREDESGDRALTSLNYRWKGRGPAWPVASMSATAWCFRELRFLNDGYSEQCEVMLCSFDFVWLHFKSIPGRKETRALR